jgi:hypothetical protein
MVRIYIVGYKRKAGQSERKQNGAREMKSKSRLYKQASAREEEKQQNAVPFDNTKHIKLRKKNNTRKRIDVKHITAKRC